MITSHIKETAEKRGIKNANQLRVALDVSPTLAARLWKGDFDMIGMVTLDKLCRVLRCQPDKLLNYKPDEKSIQHH
jgi:DNA-binding Xre family transcriptional regulator